MKNNGGDKGMKVVILAGGFGTRISEESHLKPKPMVEIGYKQEMIKKWFADYYLHSSDITFDFTQKNKMIVHNNISEPWKVTLVDTGLNTMTGGRIKRVKEHLNGEPFFLTYGDGVSDVNIKELLEFHKQGGRMAGQPHKNIHLEKYFLRWIFLNVFHNFLKNQFLWEHCWHRPGIQNFWKK